VTGSTAFEPRFHVVFQITYDEPGHQGKPAFHYGIPTIKTTQVVQARGLERFPVNCDRRSEDSVFALAAARSLSPLFGGLIYAHFLPRV
jgi:hypothetical protein